MNSVDVVSKNAQILNLMKIRPVGAELFHAVGRTDTQTDRQTDRQTDMKKLIVALRISANTPISDAFTRLYNNMQYDFPRDCMGAVQTNQCTTPRNRVPLQALIVHQQGKQFQAFYGTQICIIVTHLRFPLWCCWGLISCGMWRCITGLMYTDVSKESSAFTFKAVRSFERSGEAPTQNFFFGGLTLRLCIIYVLF
jgi:hypothetical protein